MHAAAQTAADIPLQLEVFLNGRPLNVVAGFTRHPDGSFSAQRGELAALGLKVPRALPQDAEIPLAQLAGVRYEYDEPRQAMRLTAIPEAQEPTLIDGRPSADVPPPQRPPNGLLFNYDALAGVQRDDRSRTTRTLAATIDARAFGPWGVLEHEWTDRFLDVGAGPRRLRLNTTYTYDMPQSLRTFQLGDVITGGFSWTRPIRMGGVQLRRSFDLRPDLITAPLPTLGGTAAAPSSLELYVNEVRALSARVKPGPFRIDNPPLLIGSGQARLVLRDVLGHESVTVVPFYTSPRLLVPGLTDYSATVGLARRNFGIDSSDYFGKLAATGSARVGVTRKLTLEGHAEATKDMAMAGGGVAVGVGNWGVATASAAASHSDIGNGALGELTLEAKLRPATVLARVQRASRRYRDLAGWTQVQRPTLTDEFRVFGQPLEVVQLSASVPLGRQASLGLGYVRVVDAPGESSNIQSVSLNKNWGRANLFASYLRDRDRPGSGTLFLGLSVPLGKRVALSSGITRGASTRSFVEAARQASDAPGALGWSVLAGREDGQTEARATLRYAAPAANLELSRTASQATRS